LKTAKVLQIPFSEKEVAEVLDEIESPVGFEEVRNKLIIDLFYTTGIRRTELIHLKICDIDVSKFSMKVLGKGIKKNSSVLLLSESFFVFKRAIAGRK
jgi:integrase/recombinase XerC